MKIETKLAKELALAKKSSSSSTNNFQNFMPLKKRLHSINGPQMSKKRRFSTL